MWILEEILVIDVTHQTLTLKKVLFSCLHKKIKSGGKEVKNWLNDEWLFSVVNVAMKLL